MRKHSSYFAQAGFSMLEVLVTIGIVSFGMLAVAAMFMKGIQSHNSSFLRSVAAQQAYDLADRMRANALGTNANNYDNVTFSGTQTCSSISTPATLAAYDVCTWNNQNASLLPSGRGTVSRSGVVYAITVSWDDSRSGSADKSFVIRVDP